MRGFWRSILHVLRGATIIFRSSSGTKAVDDDDNGNGNDGVDVFSVSCSLRLVVAVDVAFVVAVPVRDRFLVADLPG